MELQLSISQQGTLLESKKEFEDLSKLISIEIANTIEPIAKAQLIETKLKVLTAIINLDKQRKEIFPLQRI